jgi:hypothetical protein
MGHGFVKARAFVQLGFIELALADEYSRRPTAAGAEEIQFVGDFCCSADGDGRVIFC